jgi:hypothetical protein
MKEKRCRRRVDNSSMVGRKRRGLEFFYVLFVLGVGEFEALAGRFIEPDEDGFYVVLTLAERARRVGTTCSAYGSLLEARQILLESYSFRHLLSLSSEFFSTSNVVSTVVASL